MKTERDDLIIERYKWIAHTRRAVMSESEELLDTLRLLEEAMERLDRRQTELLHYNNERLEETRALKRLLREIEPFIEAELEARECSGLYGEDYMMTPRELLHAFATKSETPKSLEEAIAYIHLVAIASEAALHEAAEARG